MNKYLTYACLSVVMSLAGNARATTATTADLSGIRLYMTPAQVISAIKTKYGPAKRLRIESHSGLRGGINDTIYRQISLDDGVFSLEVTFCMAPNPSFQDIAYYISFTTERGTESDAKGVFDSANKKFGSPELSFKSDGGNQINAWCKVHTGDGKCDQESGPVLFVVENGNILMTDFAMQKRSLEYEIAHPYGNKLVEHNKPKL